MQSGSVWFKIKTVVTITVAASVLGMSTSGQVKAQESANIDSLDLEHLLDNIVVSVSKHEETLDEAPGNVFLITREMIDRYSFESVSDALAIVPGLYVNKDFTTSTVGVRGMNIFGDWNSRVVLLIDGRSSVELYSGTSNFDATGISIDNLERIEVVKGPASSLYGSNAFFGTINLITRKPTGNAAQTSSVVSSATGSGQLSALISHYWQTDFSVQANLSVDGRLGSKLFFPEYSALDSTTLSLDENGSNQYYLDSADYTAGVADRRNKFKSGSAHVVVRKGNWSLTGQYAQGETGVAQSMWGSLFNKSQNKIFETRGFVDLGYEQEVSRSLDFSARLSYDSWKFVDHILYNYYILEASPAYLPGPLWIDLERDHWWGGEMRANWEPFHRTRITVGLDGKFHHVHQESGEAAPDLESVNGNVISSAVASMSERVITAYTQIDQRLSDKFKLTGGVQINHQSFTKGTMIPKAAVVITPQKGTAIKLIASRGYRAPTMYEMTFDDGWYYMGNADLEPEIITNYEMVLSKSMPYGFEANLSGFVSRIDKLIVQTAIDSTDGDYPTTGTYGESVNQYRNSGHLKTSGIEVTVQRNPIYRLSGFASMSFADVTQESTTEQAVVPNSVEWLASGGASYQLIQRKLSISMMARYTGNRMLFDGSRLASSTLVDVSLSWKRAIGPLSIHAGVTNIFDSDYRAPLSQDYAPATTIGQPGRSILARLSLGR